MISAAVPRALIDTKVPCHPVGARQLLFRAARFVFTLAVLAGCTGCKCSNVDPHSSVIVLVDLSKSFAPFSADDKNTLTEIGKAVVALSTKLLNPPVKIYWTSISSSSETDASPCGSPVVFKRSLLQSKSPNEKGRARDLTPWIEACVDSVIALGERPVEFTDISHAFRVARDASSAGLGRRIVVAYSDFQEDLPPGATPSPLSMPGFDIVMISRPSSKADGDPSDAGRRVEEWKQRLEESGANVCERHSKGLMALDIASCIRSL